MLYLLLKILGFVGQLKHVFPNMCIVYKIARYKKRRASARSIEKLHK